MKLFNVDKFYKGCIIKRPSLSIKSPYIADVSMCSGEKSLAHTPSLGCCGLANANSGFECYFTKSKNKKRASKYTLDVVRVGKVLIGINPMYANDIVQSMIEKKIINLKFTNMKREAKIGNSRFDFVLEKTRKDIIIEVKNVPLALDPKTNCKYDTISSNMDKIAVFPDGYKKTKDSTVSERAIKHINELIHLQGKYETYLVFIIQRKDCKYFSPSDVDPLFRKTLKKAKDAGVKIMAYSVYWKGRDLFFHKKLIIKDNQA